MKKLNMFLMLALIGFGFFTQEAKAQLTTVPDLSLQTAATNVTGKHAMGSAYNARIAIAPYAQVTANETYTFIGISHPSLDTAHTSIGVAVEAMDMTTVGTNAKVFTVQAGETHRVFIVNQSHSTINANNANFTDSNTHLITTTDANQYGSIKVTGVGSSPTVPTKDTDRGSTYQTLGAAGTIFRFDNVSQLAMWGVVYKASNGAGFGLEFIGDMHDSSLGTSGLGNATHNAGKTQHRVTAGSGRGIN